MTRTYECMFLIDNDVVRAGWGDAKSSVAELVRKHGGEVHTSRRWDERRLTYPIRHRRRATYLLNYCEFPNDGLEGLRRDLDISETVLRYMIVSAKAVPEKERELSAAEDVEGFQIPEPPADDTPEPEEPLGVSDEDGAPAPRRREEAKAAPAAAAEEAPAEDKKAEDKKAEDKKAEDPAAPETVKTSEEG